MSILEAPEAITIHRRDQSGNLSILQYSFASSAAPLSAPDSEIVLKALYSLNCYTASSGCAFEPGILFRLIRANHYLDILVCFKCEDLVWTLDNNPSVTSQIGLSELGISTFKSVLHRQRPNDPAFKRSDQ